MVKYIYSIGLMMSCICAVPAHAEAYANPELEIIENGVHDIDISVTESTVRVTGANGQTLSIYNVAGVRVFSRKIDSLDKRIELNLPKGCYIIKVGKTVRKISLR